MLVLVFYKSEANMKGNAKKVYIIGAGLAGLSSAYALANKGVDVTIYESTKMAGGRCRSFHDEILDREIDNGNHLILGANNHVVNLIKKLNIEGRFYQKSAKTIWFNSLKNKDKYQLNLSVKTLFKILLANKHQNIEEILGDEKLLKLIALSIFNTKCDRVEIGELKKIIYKILLGGRNALNAYIPKKSWSDGLINPLVEHIENKGINIHYNHPLKEIIFENEVATKLKFTDKNIELSANDRIILATPPQITAKFLPNTTIPNAFNPIVNVHFVLDHDRTGEIEGLVNSSVEWAFFKDGIISTTSSDAGKLADLTNQEIADIVWGDLQKIMDLPDEIPPYRVIKEKRATISCTPENLKLRPTTNTEYSNLFLAGDYVDTNLPATIESAVISGQLAANKIDFASVVS